MRIGYLILNYKDAERSLAAGLAAAAMDCVQEVLIVDNCSPDDSWERLQTAAGGKLSVLRSKKNGGYSYGNNLGVRCLAEKGCDVIAIANPDVSVSGEDLLLLAEALADPAYAVVSGMEYDKNAHPTRPILWSLKTYRDDIRSCFPLISRLLTSRGKEEALPAPSLKPQPAEILRGSFLVCRTADFLNAGGFDEKVFLYCEERILAKRIEQTGKRLGFVSAASYIHDHASSMEREYCSAADRMKLLHRSVLYYQDVYCHIGRIRHFLLFLCMKWAVFEFGVRDRIRKQRRERK